MFQFEDCRFSVVTLLQCKDRTSRTTSSKELSGYFVGLKSVTRSFKSELKTEVDEFTRYPVDYRILFRERWSYHHRLLGQIIIGVRL